MDHTELVQRAKAIKFYRDAVLELGSKLSKNDAELDHLLGELVASKEDLAFTRVIFAALGTGRRVDARHLVEGACLFAHPGLMSNAAWHCAGHVGEALVSAVRSGLMGCERDVTALLVAALWCQEHPNFAKPADLIILARSLARDLRVDPISRDVLMVLANVTGDEGLKRALQLYDVSITSAFEQLILKAVFSDLRASPLATVPETPPPTVISGFTVRRAVERVGRNDPCPCGSGKKYKKCCYDKDRQRLLQSSSVPGMTTEELREQPDAGLSRQRIADMRSYELSKIDCLKVPPDLRGDFGRRLMAFGMMEQVVAALEKWPWTPATSRIHYWVVYEVTRAQNKPLLERLIQRAPDHMKNSLMDLAASLTLAQGDGGKQMELIEKAALKALRADEPDAQIQLVDLAHALLDCRPALGILVARAVIPVSNPLDADTLLQSLLDARDKLSLSPADPMCEVVDEMLFRPIEEEHEEPEELKEARQNLAAKNREVRKLQNDLENLNRDLGKRKESDQVTKSAAPVKPPKPIEAQLPAPVVIKQEVPVVDDSAIRLLRERLDSVKSLLKERHNERNQLRHELKSAREQIERLSVKSDSPTTSSFEEEDADDLWLEAGDVEVRQPLRLPEFPRKFLDTLASLPSSVSRASISMTGRLAGGDATAFTGVKRLKALPDVYRQRVSKDYRLLFRLHPERLEIVDLIHRRDLERKIKAMH